MTSRDVSRGKAHTDTNPLRFKSLAGADEICAEVAAKAALPGHWRAVLSDSNESAKDRVLAGGPIYNLGGVKIENSSPDLWDDDFIDKPVELNEKGDRVSDGSNYVWTGTATNGESDGNEHCANWTSSAEEFAETGNALAPDEDWIQLGDGGTTDDNTADLQCNDAASLYCIDGTPMVNQ